MPKIKKRQRVATTREDYPAFLKSLDVSWIALIQSNFRVDRDKLLDDEGPVLGIFWRCQPTMVGKKHFEATANLLIKMNASKSKQEVMHLEAAFQMHIHSSNEIVRANVQRFTNSEVRLLIWPYFREYVSNTCNRMHVPPVFLPLTGSD